MVMAIILFMGKVSGAHLNPVVTLAFALRRDFPWRRVPGYFAAELGGAALACLFLTVTFPTHGNLGATLPGAGITDLQAFAVEAVLTLGLVSTILGTASGAQNVGHMSAVAVGGYIALAGLWSSPVSGASMNPARSFGPALVSWGFAHFWVYVAGPLTGAFVAADPSPSAAVRLADIWTALSASEVFSGSLISRIASLARSGTHLHGNESLRAMIDNALPGAMIEDLPIHFECVAASIE